jgi:hypothetical protein
MCPFSKYKHRDGFVDNTDYFVRLGEFRGGKSMRLLPSAATPRTDTHQSRAEADMGFRMLHVSGSLLSGDVDGREAILFWGEDLVHVPMAPPPRAGPPTLGMERTSSTSSKPPQRRELGGGGCKDGRGQGRQQGGRPSPKFGWW